MKRVSGLPAGADVFMASCSKMVAGRACHFGRWCNKLSWPMRRCGPGTCWVRRPRAKPGGTLARGESQRAEQQAVSQGRAAR